jgi:hypothetical protein
MRIPIGAESMTFPVLTNKLDLIYTPDPGDFD